MNVTVTAFVTPPTATVTVAMPAVRDVTFAEASPFVVRCTVDGELLSVNDPKFVENVTCVSLATGALFCVALTAMETGVDVDTAALDADTSSVTAPLPFPVDPTNEPGPLTRLLESQPAPAMATAASAASILDLMHIGRSFHSFRLYRVRSPCQRKSTNHCRSEINGFTFCPIQLRTRRAHHGVRSRPDATPAR